MTIWRANSTRPIYCCPLINMYKKNKNIIKFLEGIHNEMNKLVDKNEQLEYSLISEVIRDEENKPHTIYGVKVRCIKSDGTEEIKEISDLTFDKGRMIAFINKMENGDVRFDSLMELAEDFVTEESIV